MLQIAKRSGQAHAPGVLRGCACQRPTTILNERDTHDVNPITNLGSILTGFPVSSRGASNENTESNLAMASHMEASARTRPAPSRGEGVTKQTQEGIITDAQIRFPNPKGYCTVSSFKIPWSSKNRLGLKLDGSGYLVSSCAIALYFRQIGKKEVC